MGATCLTFCFSDLDASNWIDITAIVVNSVLAIWVVKVLQNNLSNKRVLKDHFINEIKDLQNEYKSFFKLVATDELEVKTVVSWFKLMNIRVNDTMGHLSKLYKTDSNLMNPFKIELRNLTTDSNEYIAQYSTGGKITFTDSTKLSYIKFQQDNLNVFSKIIVDINNH